MPCYLLDNVDRQREGVFDGSIRALKRLNALGYGRDETGSPSTSSTTRKGRRCRRTRSRSRPTTSVSSAKATAWCSTDCSRLRQHADPALRLDPHLQRTVRCLPGAPMSCSPRRKNLAGVMCRTLLSVDYRGYVYDCDFNQMLDLPLARGPRERLHLSELLDEDIAGNPIRVAGHCFGCTAGQGSSCGGALNEAAERRRAPILLRSIPRWWGRGLHTGAATGRPDLPGRLPLRSADPRSALRHRSRRAVRGRWALRQCLRA